MAKKEEKVNIEYMKALDNATSIKVKVDEEMKKSFIAYAMAVNVSRAIPDVRDGLKPVHRRILFAMNDMGNTYDKPTKNARVLSAKCLASTILTATAPFTTLLSGLRRIFRSDARLSTGRATSVR